MKLLPVYKPGTVKKALLAFVGIGATGAVIKYKSHSEAHLQGPDLEDWQEEHGLAWYLQEALHVASGSAKGASHTLLHLLGSLRHAWAVRYVPSGSGPSAEQRMSLPVAVAEFLSSMAEESDGQGGAASRVGYVLAGYKVLDWLLDTAVANPGSPEHFAVERFLAKVLSDEEATCALLERPGAIPKLLRLVASELASDGRSSSQTTQATLHLAWQQQGQQNEQQQLQQGHGQGQQPHAIDDDMLAEAQQAALHPLMTAVIHGGKLPMRVQQEDMQAVLVMACEPGQGHDAQLLAMQLLTALAQTSVLNCKAIAGAGGGRRLAGLAASSSTGVDVDGMQLEIARLMTTLARNCPDRGDLKMSRWLYHLLCFAADASANRNWQLAAASLQAFANCLRAGSKIQDSLMRGNALPLLHQLADWQRQQAQHAQQQGGVAGSGGSSGPLMRAAIASAVGSLVETRRERFPLAEREHWGEVLLGWMSEQPLDESLQHHELLKALAGALAGLAAIPGPDGLHIAHAWLAEMIVHLSRQIEAARPGRKAPQQQARGAAAAAGGTTPGSATGGSSGSDSTSSWWKFWAKDSPPPAGGVEAAAAAPGSLAAVVDSGSEEVSALAEAAAVVEFEAELPPGSTAATERASASSSSSSGDGAGQPVGGEQQAYEDGWGSHPWWKPWGSPGGGSKQGDSPSPMQAAAGSAGPAAGSAGPSAAAAAGGGRESAAAEALVRRPTSDPELSEFLRAAPVGPLYARSVAAELLEASGRVGSYQEPPPDAEELMSPDAIAAYAKVAAAVDMEVADKALCQALKVLCALVSGDADKQRWVRLVGVLPLLHRLTIGHPRDIPEVTDPDYFSESLPLCVRRQSARLLAMLTADLEGARAVRKGGWVPWLQNVAASSDCKISSCAARALLHLESAAALQRHALALRPPWQLAKQLKRSALPPLLPGPEPDPEGDVLEEARQRLQAVRRRLDRQLDAVRPPVLPQHRLVMSDGVHLFDPLATHHEILAREGTDSRSTDAPLVDVVFVHGIRGGAFATWRREGVLQHGQARENLERDTCWPGAWLAKELPEARLLTVEYPAPASGWEGESLPLTHTAVRLMDKLAAAGVGNRPVVFVAHSMGGLVVKELLARAAADDSERFHGLAQNARGAVFYSVPHFGAKLAAYGWQLRYVGGSPAAAVEQLRPGPHLDAINSCVKAMYKSGRLPVLSFSEGLQTRLGYMKASIVPHESAFPGYGEFVVLSHHDHINVCKPLDKDDPAYAKLADFLKARVEEVKAEVAEQIVESMDGLEPAV